MSHGRRCRLSSGRRYDREPERLGRPRQLSVIGDDGVELIAELERPARRIASRLRSGPSSSPARSSKLVVDLDQLDPVERASCSDDGIATTGKDRPDDQSRFGVCQSSASLSWTKVRAPEIGIRSCASESRSRIVIVSSSSVCSSIVSAYGVPISSWRR